MTAATALTPEQNHAEKMREADSNAALLQSSVDLSMVPPSSWHKRKMIAFDLETTNTDVEEARIVTASVIEFYGDVFNPDKRVVREWIVNPGIEIPAVSTSIHGYTTEQVQQEGISPQQAITELVTILRAEMRAGHAVVGYNLSYDFTVLHREALRYDLDYIKDEEIVIVDPSVIDNAWDKYRKGKRRLTDVASVYGVPPFDAHNSSADCIATAQIAYRMAEIYISDIKVPVETLMSWQRIWRKRWAEEKYAYLSSQGRIIEFNRFMGIQPMPGEEPPFPAADRE